MNPIAGSIYIVIAGGISQEIGHVFKSQTGKFLKKKLLKQFLMKLPTSELLDVLLSDLQRGFRVLLKKRGAEGLGLVEVVAQDGFKGNSKIIINRKGEQEDSREGQ